MITLLLSLTLLLTSCTDNSSYENSPQTTSRLLEDLEHYIKDDPDTLKYDSTILYTGWYYVVDSSNGYKRQLDKSDKTYYLDPKPIVTAQNFTTFEVYESNFNDKKYWGLAMRLNKEGTISWSNATLKTQGKELAFILDDRLLQVAKVHSQIIGGVTALNRGDYSKEELENFKTIIASEK